MSISLKDVLALYEKFEAGQASDEQLRAALKKLYPEELLSVFRTGVSADEKQIEKSLSARDSTGDSLPGIAALSWEDLQRLRKAHPDKPIIYVTDDGGSDTIGKLSFVGGVIVIGKTASHMKAYTTNLPCLIWDDASAGKQGIVLDTKNGALLKNGKPILRSGDPVTLDPENRRLFLEELETIPAKAQSPAYQGLIKYIYKELGNPKQDYFSFQADKRSQVEQLEQCDDPLGLCRMENCYEGTSDVLLRAIEHPSRKNIQMLKAVTKAHFHSMFEGSTRRYRELVFRGMDFNDRFSANLKGDSSTLRSAGGFYAFASKHREVYRAQMEALLEVAPEFLEKGSVLRFIVPNAETVEDLKLAKDILREAQLRNPMRRPGSKYASLTDNQFETSPTVAIGAMVESVKGVNNTAALLDEMAIGHPNVPLMIKIGGSDLTTDHTGVERNDNAGIEEWMKKNKKDVSPFEYLFPELQGSLEKITDAAQEFKEKNRQNVIVDFCGIHASGSKSYIVNTMLEVMGIKACIPVKQIYTQGFPSVRALAKLREKWVDEIIEAKHRSELKNGGNYAPIGAAIAHTI